MNVLELFSGTGSVKKACHSIGWESVSVDMLLPADHQCDIMQFDYKQYPKDYFQLIWASPPCTQYSNLQSCWIGRMRKGKMYTREVQEQEMNEADKLVIKTLEIIEYFNPHLWFIENPQTGKLKSRDIMKDIPFYDVDYCMYSDFGYQKRTRVWTNKKDFIPKLCDKSGACGNMIDTKQKNKIHRSRMGTSKTIIDDGNIVRVNTNKLRIKYKNYENLNNKLNSPLSQLDRYRVPQDLILSLLLD